MTTKKSYDVLVVGAGPAGSALSAHLARAGIHVLLVESSALERRRPGEFLSPHARALVNRSALLPSDWESRHKSIHHFVGSWGSPSDLCRDFIFEARGHALALDRLTFDRQLAAAAVSHGATLLTHAKVQNSEMKRELWEVSIDCGEEHHSVQAAFIAVCVGRTGIPVPRIPFKRHRLDRLFCLGLGIANFPVNLGPSIESYARGWTYSVVLNSAELVLNICTESAGQSNRHFRSPSVVLEELACCPIAASRVLAAGPTVASDMTFFAADASSSVTRPATGEGWCLAGDCVQSMDPLSSSGVMNAFQHAEMIFECITRSRTIKDADLNTYSHWLDQTYQEYLASRHRFYNLEKRWPSPFWQTRQAISLENLTFPLQ